MFRHVCGRVFSPFFCPLDPGGVVRAHFCYVAPGGLTFHTRRGGIPVRGDEFTLGPGANAGEVTGGASWRMVVDLSKLGHSFGMYPGGQSEDPSSPHYDDQMKPWAAGRYLPLYFYPSPQAFPAGQVESALVLEPKQ